MKEWTSKGLQSKWYMFIPSRCMEYVRWSEYIATKNISSTFLCARVCVHAVSRWILGFSRSNFSSSLRISYSSNWKSWRYPRFQMDIQNNNIEWRFLHWIARLAAYNYVSFSTSIYNLQMNDHEIDSSILTLAAIHLLGTCDLRFESR